VIETGLSQAATTAGLMTAAGLSPEVVTDPAIDGIAVIAS
jgi:hypothetical protein